MITGPPSLEEDAEDEEAPTTGAPTPAAQRARNSRAQKTLKASQAMDDPFSAAATRVVPDDGMGELGGVYGRASQTSGHENGSGLAADLHRSLSQPGVSHDSTGLSNAPFVGMYSSAFPLERSPGLTDCGMRSVGSSRKIRTAPSRWRRWSTTGRKRSRNYPNCYFCFFPIL